MRRAINRLWDWLFHPSVRRQDTYGKAIKYRYPAPGGQIRNLEPQDYKTPFSDGQYDVRYHHLTPIQTRFQQSQVKLQARNIDPIRKLVLLGYLKDADKKEQSAIEDAKKRYQIDYKKPFDDFVSKNDFKVYYPDPKDKEGVRQAYQMDIESASIDRQQNLIQADYMDTEKLDMMHFESLDLYGNVQIYLDSPHFQQARVQNMYKLDQIANENISNKGFQMTRGQRSFWKVIDDSHDPENIQKVQRKIGDEDPLNFQLRKDKMQFVFDEKGEIIDIKPKK